LWSLFCIMSGLSCLFVPVTGITRPSSRSVWDRDSTVQFYARREGLLPAEENLFSRRLSHARSILDLGVGGGRTTPFLAPGRHYLGVDLVQGMVDTCRAKYPELDFRTGDAADLSWCRSHSFDAVVFSYNGLDYLFPDLERRSALQEIHRVLRPSGTFIFSRHDPVGGVGRRRFFRALRLGYRGGYALDHLNGGWQTTHYATPMRVTSELDAHGFSVLDVVPDGPGIRPAWWYYAARRLD